MASDKSPFLVVLLAVSYRGGTSFERNVGTQNPLHWAQPKIKLPGVLSLIIGHSRYLSEEYQRYRLLV